jgi:DNA-binding response OmpR family regulator
MDAIGILILDDDASSHGALQQMLDSEGWRVSVVSSPDDLLPELAKGQTQLIIANAARTGLSGPVFDILQTLALAPTTAEKTVARVLFLVPSLAAAEAQPRLEKLGLNYLLKPYHLHDFLEKVSDLLMEAGAIKAPMRQVRRDHSAPLRSIGARSARTDQRRHTMFASRDDYFMTEEELNEYERQEAEERAQKKKKKDPHSLD